MSSADVGTVFSAGPDNASPDSSDSKVKSSAPVSTQREALVAALITSMREIFKIEDSAEAADLPVPFGTHKPVRSVCLPF